MILFSFPNPVIPSSFRIPYFWNSYIFPFLKLLRILKSSKFSNLSTKSTHFSIHKFLIPYIWFSCNTTIIWLIITILNYCFILTIIILSCITSLLLYPSITSFLLHFNLSSYPFLYFRVILLRPIIMWLYLITALLIFYPLTPLTLFPP